MAKKRKKTSTGGHQLKDMNSDIATIVIKIMNVSNTHKYV